MPTLHRRQLLSASTAMAMLVLGHGAPARAASQRVVLVAEERGGFAQLPLLLAEQLGYFQAEGLELQVVEPPAGTRAWQLLSGGGADVASGPYEHILTRQLQGQALQAFVLLTRAPQLVLGVSPRQMPYFRRPDDLRGRRIGVAAMGSPAHRLGQQVLDAAGVAGPDVEFVEVGAGWSALNPYRSGQIDALCHAEPVVTSLEQRGEIRVVTDTRTLRGTTDFFGGPLPGHCLYASEEFVQRQGQVGQALSHALVRTLKWLQTAGPSDLIKAVSERHMLGDRALFLAVLAKLRDSYTTDGLMPAGGPAVALRHLLAFMPALRDEKLDLTRSFSNQWAVRSKARFRA